MVFSFEDGFYIVKSSLTGLVPIPSPIKTEKFNYYDVTFRKDSKIFTMLVNEVIYEKLVAVPGGDDIILERYTTNGLKFYKSGDIMIEIKAGFINGARSKYFDINEIFKSAIDEYTFALTSYENMAFSLISNKNGLVHVNKNIQISYQLKLEGEALVKTNFIKLDATDELFRTTTEVYPVFLKFIIIDGDFDEVGVLYGTNLGPSRPLGPAAEILDYSKLNRI